MKRICVVTSDVPFVEGGHLVIARELVKQFQIHGYQAELVTTPQNPFGKQFGAYLANFNTVLTEAGDGKPIDAVVSFRFPSYAVGHSRHSCWINHRMREYYDLWPKFKEHLSWKGKIKESVRRFVIHRIDEFCLDHRVKKLYAQSETIRNRLRNWGGHDCEVLYPPAVKADYRCEEYGNYIFAISRVIDHKRLDLVVRAGALHKIPVVIGGDGPDLEKLQKLAKELGAERTTTFLGRISHQELLDHYAKCRAVAFPSFNEDYGLITLEAFSSSKPVITLQDSGGPTEIVEDKITGRITEVSVQKFAEAFKELIEDKDLAEKMGSAAETVAKKHTWAHVIEKLLEW